MMIVTNSTAYMIGWIVVLVIMIFATVPTLVGRVVLTCYTLIIVAVFKVIIDGVPIV